MLGGILRILVVALVLLVAALFWRPQLRPTPADDLLLPQALALPDVALTDQSGQSFTRDALRGDFSLLFFGFTHCPDVCPLTLKVLADARAEIAKRSPGSAPRVVFVSVDPARDTPERIASYLASFDTAFRGVTGADAALQPLLATLGVAVEKHDHGGGVYAVMHSAAVYVIGPGAELIAILHGEAGATLLASQFLRIRQSHLATARPRAA